MAKKMSVVYVPECANCHKPGNMACKGCLLATYCRKSCQTQHWNVHKQDCNSPLKQQHWQPVWVHEFRKPAFVGDAEDPVEFHGTRKYLWGNVPSVDIVKLEDNEGATYGRDLNILFAASGDPRNVFKTIASLPQSYVGKPFVVINDMDFDVVARNLIMLLLSLTIADEQEAIQTVLHVWYSAFIRPVDLQRIQALHPLIKDVCTKIASRGSGSLQAKTFTFGPSSLRVVLKKEHWKILLTFLCPPKGLTIEKARRGRLAVTMAPHRLDYLHRDLALQQPEHRICKERFREDGILLPFSQSRDDFTVPNPTFYQTTEWPMLDAAEPIDGWDFAELLETNIGNAAHDLYGKLYVHVGSLLLSFKDRLSTTGVNFLIHNMNATELHKNLAPNTFARIETSNICDRYCLGPARTLSHLSELLHPLSENPHATLLNLFMNAIVEMENNGMEPTGSEMELVVRYPSIINTIKTDPLGIGMLVMMAAAPFGKDVEKIFAAYKKEYKFDEFASLLGMKMKDRHTIIEKWPTRPKLEPGQPHADNEIAKLLATNLSHAERYVEWKRAV